MIPKISVLTVTCRTDPFLLEQIVGALAHQTFKDFEWILIDDHFQETKDKVKQEIDGRFKCIHTAPDVVPPYFARSAALNDGLRYCNGKYVYFMCDYSIPQKDCLGRHWEIQEKYGGVLLTGRRIKIEMPLEEYLDIVKSNDHTRKVSWSDFNIQFFEQGDGNPDNNWKLAWTPLGDNLFEVIDKKEGAKRWMSGRNDSCPLEALLEVNGFEEMFDGSWGCEDADIGQRLMKYGMRFLIDKGSQCIELPHTSAEKKQVRSEKDRMKLQVLAENDVLEEGNYRANSRFIYAMPRDLRAEREEIRKQL